LEQSGSGATGISPYSGVPKTLPKTAHPYKRQLILALDFDGRSENGIVCLPDNAAKLLGVQQSLWLTDGTESGTEPFPSGTEWCRMWKSVAAWQIAGCAA
jgi:hypothetical protein